MGSTERSQITSETWELRMGSSSSASESWALAPAANLCCQRKKEHDSSEGGSFGHADKFLKNTTSL